MKRKIRKPHAYVQLGQIAQAWVATKAVLF